MFNFIEKKVDNFNLKLLKSDIFPDSLECFFTTRIGGYTPIPLNTFTLSAKDYIEFDNYAEKNLKIACKLLNANYENLIMPNQQHTDNIFVLKNQNDIETIKETPFDGVITNLKNIPIVMVFADCVPIVMFDEKNKVLACIHAGWKGTSKKIVQKALKIMINKFNSNEQNIKVAIGAAICQKCFDVNYDVAVKLGLLNNHGCDNMFIEHNDKFYVNLKQLNKIQLTEMGVDKIDICGYCTCCNNDIFYSYRADNKCTGRHGILAIIKE